MYEPPRELAGHDLLQAIQRFEWRFQTLQTGYEELMEVRDPDTNQDTIQHRYTNRSRLHEAERRLHNYLSSFYTFKSLISTLSDASTSPEFGGRIKHWRDGFALEESSRIILGLRHYVQHHDVIPLLAKISNIRPGGPWYVINKNNLARGGFEYREPQMVRDVPQYDDWFDYYYEGVDSICIYPFGVVVQNWDQVTNLRDKIYDLARAHLSEDLDEYIEELERQMEIREELRNEHEAIDQLLDRVEGINPDLKQLLLPKIHDSIIEKDADDT